MRSLQLGRSIVKYSGVRINAGQNENGDELIYEAGDDSGYVLEIQNPYGSQGIADRILADLKYHGVPYQPFNSEDTFIDPAFEIGDAVTVAGKRSTIWNAYIKHTGMMAATLSAPFEEELDHEFHYEPKSERTFKRETTKIKSRLSITADSIKSEVLRATESEAALGSRLSITADSIESEVIRATGSEAALGSMIEQRLDSITLSVTSENGSSTFTLKDGAATLDTKTLDMSVSAVNIYGKLTADQISVSELSALGATIGGWSISDTTLRKQTDTNDVYFQSATGSTGGYNAISVRTRANASASWVNKFYVQYNGHLYAADATIEGSITATSGVIGGVSIQNGTLSGITDTNIATGGISGGSGGSIGYGTLSTYNTSGGINTSLGYADFAHSVFNGADRATSVWASSFIIGTPGTQLTLQQMSFKDGLGNTRTIHYLGYA